MDINQLPEKKKKNKIIIQREKDATKAKDKLEKEIKKAEKSGKSKPSTPPILLIETSYASPSQNPRK